MTLLPAQDPRIKGVEGPRYRVGPFCEVPGCKRPVDHAHHLWRRSFLMGPRRQEGRGGDFWWVEVPDGEEMRVIGNVIGICWRHHDDVTGKIGGHKAAVVYSGGALYWVPFDSEPPDPSLLVDYKDLIPIRPFDGVRQAPVREPERCQGCGRRLPRQPRDLAKRKSKARRKTRFVVMVPQDSEEDGHALLTSLIDDAAERLGRGEGEGYFTLVDALNWFVTYFNPEAEIWEGEGPCPTCGTILAA